MMFTRTDRIIVVELSSVTGAGTARECALVPRLTRSTGAR